jgi:hypothetical protein
LPLATVIGPGRGGMLVAAFGGALIRNYRELVSVRAKLE